MAQFFPCAVLCVDVVHSAFPDRRWAELRFPASMTVEAAQDKLYHHTGTPPSRMKLYAYTPGRKLVMCFCNKDHLCDYLR